MNARSRININFRPVIVVDCPNYDTDAHTNIEYVVDLERVVSLCLFFED